MTLGEKAVFYYTEQEKCCAEAVLLAASDLYGLKLSPEEAQLFAGFGGGMGCGSTCGALSGAIGVLSRMYGAREDLRELCASFVLAFTKALACGTYDCETLAARYKNDDTRCAETVSLTCTALEKYLNSIESPAEITE